MKSKGLTLSRHQNIDSSKFKNFADDNFQFYENGASKFYKGVKNTVWKAEIVRNRQSLLPIVFLKDLYCRHLKNLSHTILTFNDLGKRSLLKTLCEKEKILVTSIFSFSHNVFYPCKDKFQFLSHIYFVICKCFQFEQV